MSSANNSIARNTTDAGGDHNPTSANNKLGTALGEEVAGLNSASANFALAPGAMNIFSFPGTVNDLAGSSVTGSSVTLNWTSPGYDGNVGALQPGTSYYIRIASFTVPDTFVPGNAQIVFSVSGVNPGVLQSTGAVSLLPNTTYFAQLWTQDAAGNVSFASSRATFTTVANPPNAIADLSASTTPVVGQAKLTWTAPFNTNGASIASYTLKMSSLSVADLAGDTTAWFNLATSTTFLVSPAQAPGTLETLTLSGLPFGKYFFGIKSVDVVEEVSPIDLKAASVVDQANVLITLPPMEPFGMLVAFTSSTVNLSWSPTTRFSDGTLFASTAAPSAIELLGYNVLRSTSICAPNFTAIATNTVSVTTFTDSTGGAAYFYQVKSFNTLGSSTATLVVSSLAEYHYFLDDCMNGFFVSDSQAQALRAQTNGIGNIRIERRRRPEDTGNQIIQSGEFRAMLNGVTEIRDFRFPNPVRVVLHFTTVGGNPVAQTSALGVREAGSGVSTQASSAIRNLGMYWNNGAEWRKLYGRVDPAAQTVSVESPNLGLYQIRTQLRSEGAAFDPSGLSSRVITPNGDGLNDTLIFTYDPGPRDVLPEGRIYDLRGSFVAGMAPGLVPNTLTWDGRMNGRPVTSGVYLYQIKGDGQNLNGTIVVAR